VYLNKKRVRIASKQLIAGAKIEYEGRYGDYSWKKLLEAFNWREIIGNRI